jgi:hypothetical protein
MQHEGKTQKLLEKSGIFLHRGEKKTRKKEIQAQACEGNET